MHSAALQGFSRLLPQSCTGSGACSGWEKKQRNWPRSVTSSRPTKMRRGVLDWRSNSSSQPSCVLVSVKATPSSPSEEARSSTARGSRSHPLVRCEWTWRSISMVREGPRASTDHCPGRGSGECQRLLEDGVLPALLLGPDEVAHQHQRGAVLEDPLGVPGDQRRAVGKEELRQVLTRLAADERMELCGVHALDLLDETNRRVFLVVQDFALAPPPITLGPRLDTTVSQRQRPLTVV